MSVAVSRSRPASGVRSSLACHAVDRQETRLVGHVDANHSSSYTLVCTLGTLRCSLLLVTSEEFKRWLKKHGCTFTTDRGKGGHILVRCGERTSTLPMHGSGKELGIGLVEKIRRDLGLK